MLCVLVVVLLLFAIVWITCKQKSLQKISLAQKKLGSISFQYMFPEAFKCIPSQYINTHNWFGGGCPAPPTIMGTFGPGSIYKWSDVLTQSKPTALHSTYNVLALPNGVAMIHWDKNTLDSSLNGKYSLEMITGWGSFKSSKKRDHDFGWTNGIILNMLGKFEVPFIHIFYREITETTENGTENGFLHFWEIPLLHREDVTNTKLIYVQLKDHINELFTLDGPQKIYTSERVYNVPPELSSVLDSVLYMKLPNNGAIATMPSKFWSENFTYPENNDL